MTNFVTPAQARETLQCPLARTFAEKKGPNCMADQCACWRWKPRLASDLEFVSAIKREEAALSQEDGKGKPATNFHKKAVARVMRNPEGYGIKREEGYCGAGGPVT